MRKNWDTEMRGWSKVMLSSACVPLAGRSSLAHSWGVPTSEAALEPLSHWQPGKAQLSRVPAVLAQQSSCSLRAGGCGQPSGTAAAGEGTGPGHRLCPELGMQWSSNFCLALLLLLLTQPYHSVSGCFSKPYSFIPRHRVATPVWGTPEAVAEHDIPLG